MDKIQQELTEKGLSEKALFITDGATTHKEELFDKQRIVFEKLPAACPELNGSGQLSRGAPVQGNT